MIISLSLYIMRILDDTWDDKLHIPQKAHGFSFGAVETTYVDKVRGLV